MDIDIGSIILIILIIIIFVALGIFGYNFIKENQEKDMATSQEVVDVIQENKVINRDFSTIESKNESEDLNITNDSTLQSLNIKNNVTPKFALDDENTIEITVSNDEDYNDDFLQKVDNIFSSAYVSMF